MLVKTDIDVADIIKGLIYCILLNKLKESQYLIVTVYRNDW